MDKTTKFLLGLIAVALIGINIQLYDGTNSVIKPASAEFFSTKVLVTNQPIKVDVMNWPD